MNKGRRYGEWSKRKTKSVREQQSMRMLTEFLKAQTPQQKREVVKTFNPHYFIFGETLK